MKIHICKCEQCRLRKRDVSANMRQKVKRMLSKKRRKMKEGDTYNFYWA
jgi:hypothetical protein